MTLCLTVGISIVQRSGLRAHHQVLEQTGGRRCGVVASGALPTDRSFFSPLADSAVPYCFYGSGATQQ